MNPVLDAAQGGATDGVKLLPVMHLRSHVVALQQVKAGEAVGYGFAGKVRTDTTIALVAVGYGDVPTGGLLASNIAQMASARQT